MKTVVRALLMYGDPKGNNMRYVGKNYFAKLLRKFTFTRATFVILFPQETLRLLANILHSTKKLCVCAHIFAFPEELCICVHKFCVPQGT